MSKYIDADLLRSIVLAVSNKEPHTTDEILAMIDAVKPADVQEVKHGKWYELEHLSDLYFDYYECLLCTRISKKPHKIALSDALPFCNCGARMDGDQKEETP